MGDCAKIEGKMPAFTPPVAAEFERSPVLRRWATVQV
jgi:hypothetical protein